MNNNNYSQKNIFGYFFGAETITKATGAKIYKDIWIMIMTAR
jgi:hypothetical protein